jgi:hypothetical protein
MDGPKRGAAYHMDLDDGQFIRLDVDGRILARYRADRPAGALWLDGYEQIPVPAR